MANNAGTFFNINDNDGIPLVGVSTDGKVMINHLYGNCLIGSTSVTGTASQALQVNSGGYFNGSVGIGTTAPTSKLDVIGGAKFTGIITASQLVSNVAQGTAPITVGSSTLVTNLNANYLNGQPDTYYTNASNLTGTISSSRLSGSYGISITGTATTATTATTANNVSSTININTSGIITASSFTGNLTGTATTATTANNVSSTININTSGIITASSFTGDLTGTATTATTATTANNVSSSININTSGIITTTILNVGTSGTVITTTSSGLVGIGTTNPQGILQVGAGTSTFIVTGIGSVGIGSILPQKSLDILGANNSFIRIGKVDGFPINAIWLNDLTTSSTTWNFGSGISPVTTTLINSPPGYETRFFSGGDLKHKIDQYGNFNVGAGVSTGTASQPLQVTGGAAFYGTGSNVGIGTTNPTSKLHVIGDARVGIDTSQGVILTSPNGTKFRLFVSNTGALSTVLVP